MIFINVLSDLTMVISTAQLINDFGISTFNNKKKHKLIAILICILISATISLSYVLNYNAISVFIYPLMYIVSYFLIYGNVKLSYLYLAFVCELITTLLSSCFGVLIFETNSISYRNADAIALFFIRILLLIVSLVLKNKNNIKEIYSLSKTIPRHIFTLILISLILVTSLTAINSYQTSSDLKQIIITGFIALITITLIIIIFSLLINVASKNYYTALNSLLEKQVEAQIAHYEKLEELNRDIRQLRHDYINHLTSVSTLIEHKNYPDALQYIERLTESTHCNETIFSTGNHLADAILTGKSSECKEFADIEFNGIITDRINNIDMCAILANALDNAIEACRKCSGRSKISIAAQNKQGYWVMTMRNPTIGEDSEGLMKTSKEDTQNHGFGLLSIEQAVKRYDGNIKVGIKDGIFEISIVVKD